MTSPQWRRGRIKIGAGWESESLSWQYKGREAGCRPVDVNCCPPQIKITKGSKMITHTFLLFGINFSIAQDITLLYTGLSGRNSFVQFTVNGETVL